MRDSSRLLAGLCGLIGLEPLNDILRGGGESKARRSSVDKGAIFRRACGVISLTQRTMVELGEKEESKSNEVVCCLYA